MKPLFDLDLRDYDPTLPELYRVAVRGIVFADGKLLVVRTADGLFKLPGGGQEPGETDRDTLLREVEEETGYRVDPLSVRPFGRVEEKRLSAEKDRLFHQVNHYYCCQVTGEQGACRYTQSEQNLGFRPLWVTLEEAAAARPLDGWSRREQRLFAYLQQAGPEILT